MHEIDLNEESLDLLAVIAIDEICCDSNILPRLTVVNWWDDFDEEDNCFWDQNRSLLWNILNCLRIKGKITQIDMIKISSVVERMESFLSDENN
jgi:hypothetical protein